MRCTACVFLLLIVTAIGVTPLTFAQETRDHERYLAWFPDTVYANISFRSPAELRRFRVSREFPDSVSPIGRSRLWPFAIESYDGAYSGRVNDLKRIAALSEKTEQLISESKDPAQAKNLPKGADPRILAYATAEGFAGEIAVFSSGDLQTYLEEGLSSKKLQMTGDSISGLAVYTNSLSGLRDERILIWYSSPEPDLLIAAGSLELLRVMVRTGKGVTPGLLAGEYGADLEELFGEGQAWSFHLTSMHMDQRQRQRENSGDATQTDEAAEVWMRARNPLASIQQAIYTDDEEIIRMEQIFATEEAAKSWIEMYARNTRTPPERPDLPRELRDYALAHPRNNTFRQERTHIVNDNIRTLEQLQEYRRLQEKYKDYFEKNRQDAQKLPTVAVPAHKQ